MWILDIRINEELLKISTGQITLSIDLHEVLVYTFTGVYIYIYKYST